MERIESYVLERIPEAIAVEIDDPAALGVPLETQPSHSARRALISIRAHAGRRC